MNIDQSKYRYKRRYYRVPFVNYEDSIFELLGASLRMPSGDCLNVIDLSYSGVAVEFHQLQKVLKTNAQYHCELQLAGYPSLKVAVKIVRKTPDRMAVEFVNLSADARMVIFRFLDVRLRALQVRRVNPYFVKDEGVREIWYQGPENTNIHLYLDHSMTLHKATLEFEFGTLHYEDNVLWQEYSGKEKEFRARLTKEFYAQALGLLLHIPRKDFSVKQLISILKGYGGAVED